MISDNTLEKRNLNSMSHSLNGRVLGVDTMRVFLAFLIFLFHSQIHFDCNYYIFNDFVRMGAIAMTGFFLLSGYSMHLSSSRKDLTNVQEIKKFYTKRLITVLPLYYVVALIFVIYALVTGKLSPKDWMILFPVELFATQSTFTSLFPYSHNSGTWFISCIIICYFVYPYLQNLLLHLSVKAKMIIMIVLCGVLFYAPIIQHYFHLDYVSIYTSPFYRMIEFTIGVIVAQINTLPLKSKFLTLIRTPYSLVISFIFMVVAVTAGKKLGLPIDYMLFNVIVLPCFLIMIVSLGSMKFSKLKKTKVLLYLSSISFTFFLCQILPLWEMSRRVCMCFSMESNFGRILLSFTICMCGAIAIHHFVEKPISCYLKRKLL